MLLDFFEWLSGARMMTSFIRPGGLADDFDAGLAARVSASSSTTLPKRIDDYEALLTDNPLFKERMVGVGVLKAEDAPAHGRQRADAARLRRRPRHPQDQPVQRLRALRVRRADGARTATATTATWCAWPRCARASRSATRRSTDAGRPGADRGPQGHAAAARRAAAHRWRR